MFKEIVAELKNMFSSRDIDEVDMWRFKLSEYRRWLAEFPEIAITIDNFEAEIKQKELIDVSHPPGNKGPWDVAGLREKLRIRRDNLAAKNKLPLGTTRIVCAGNMTSKQILVTGVRHYDLLMHTNRERMHISDEDWFNCTQGFVDSSGRFLTRKEAWVVAARANQIVHYCGNQTESDLTRHDVDLYSENLY